jgi:hypothetical protein
MFIDFHSHRGFSPVIQTANQSRNRFNGFSSGCSTSPDVELLALVNFSEKVLSQGRASAAKETVKTVRCFSSAPDHRAEAPV